MAALDLPYERACTALRLGLVLIVAGQGQAAIEHLADAQPARSQPRRATARRPGRARKLAQLGDPVERRLGRRAVGLLERGGLTRRELEGEILAWWP